MHKLSLQTKHILIAILIAIIKGNIVRGMGTILNGCHFGDSMLI